MCLWSVSDQILQKIQTIQKLGTRVVKESHCGMGQLYTGSWRINIEYEIREFQQELILQPNHQLIIPTHCVIALICITMYCIFTRNGFINNLNNVLGRLSGRAYINCNNLQADHHDISSSFCYHEVKEWSIERG